MTSIEYLESIDGPTITPKQAAKVLGGRPYLLNVAAKEGRLALPHVWSGCHLKILKEPLLTLLKEETYDHPNHLQQPR